MNIEKFDQFLSPFKNLIYRYKTTLNKNFTSHHILQIPLNMKLCYQIFNNFTELYGSRLKAVQKINDICNVKYEL